MAILSTDELKAGRPVLQPQICRYDPDLYCLLYVYLAALKVLVVVQ